MVGLLDLLSGIAGLTRSGILGSLPHTSTIVGGIPSSSFASRSAVEIGESSLSSDNPPGKLPGQDADVTDSPTHKPTCKLVSQASLSLRRSLVRETSCKLLDITEAVFQLSVFAVKAIYRFCYQASCKSLQPCMMQTCRLSRRVWLGEIRQVSIDNIEAPYLTWFRWRDMCLERSVNRTEGPSSAVTSGTSTAALPSPSLAHFWGVAPRLLATRSLLQRSSTLFNTSWSATLVLLSIASNYASLEGHAHFCLLVCTN